MKCTHEHLTSSVHTRLLFNILLCSRFSYGNHKHCKHGLFIPPQICEEFIIVSVTTLTIVSGWKKTCTVYIYTYICVYIEMYYIYWTIKSLSVTVRGPWAFFHEWFSWILCVIDYNISMKLFSFIHICTIVM